MFRKKVPCGGEVHFLLETFKPPVNQRRRDWARLIDGLTWLKLVPQSHTDVYSQACTTAVTATKKTHQVPTDTTTNVANSPLNKMQTLWAGKGGNAY